MKNTPFDLTGKVAVITGSSRGIGRAIGSALAEHGAKVVISSRKADACKVAADGIRKARRRCGRHPVQHLAPRRGRGAGRGTTKPDGRSTSWSAMLRSIPITGRCSTSATKPSTRSWASNVKSNIWLCDTRHPADGGARRRLGRHHLVDRRPARLDRDRRLRHFQGGRFRPRPQPCGRIGPEQCADQLHRAGPDEDRFRPRPVGEPGCAQTPHRAHAAEPDRQARRDRRRRSSSWPRGGASSRDRRSWWTAA